MKCAVEFPLKADVDLHMGILDLFKRSKPLDPDQAVLVQLRKAGSDLAKMHAIEFFLYFPSQDSAEQAKNQVLTAGFQAEVKRAAQGDSWLCFATKQIVPELVTLQKIRKGFDALAASLGGDYDGWGTPVVK